MSIAKKKSTGRKCLTCSHSQVKDINSLINKGASLRGIARQFGLDKATINRHVDNCLNLDAAVLQKQIKVKQAINHHAELSANFEFARKSRDAAEKWLTDPNNPDEFTIVPRSTEMEIVYEQLDKDGIPYRVKRPLQDVIDDISEFKPEWSIQTVFVKAVDLRDFALKTVDKIDMVLDKFAKIQGLYTDNKANPDTTRRAANAILHVLEVHPDAPVEYVIERVCANTNTNPNEVRLLLN